MSGCIVSNEKSIKVSIIISYTDIQKLKEAESYIKEQTMINQIELIFLDNRDNRFSSAASALNYGASIAKGNILVFMHQDMYLYDRNSVQKYYEYLIKHSKTIAGVAGVAKNDGKVYSDIVETKAGVRRLNEAKGQIMEVFSLDECLLAMQKSLWQSLKFDETTCDNWHFYGVDICYSNYLLGGENVLIPVYACHDSLGNSMSREFERATKKIILKYRRRLNRIYGTCIHIKCSNLSYLWFIAKRRINAIRIRLGLKHN